MLVLRCEFESQINLEVIHILTLMTTSYNWQCHLASVEWSRGSHGPSPPIDLTSGNYQISIVSRGAADLLSIFPSWGRREEQLFMMGLNWTSVGGAGDSWVWAGVQAGV